MDIKIIASKFYDYSAYIRGYAPETIRRYRHSIDRYCTVTKVTEISNINTDNVRSLFFYGRTERGWSPNTFKCYYKSLSVFFRWCVENKYMGENPLVDIETPKIEKRLPPKLSKQDATRLLELVYNYPYEYKFLRYRNHAIFATFVFAGIRKKELTKLKLTDVDLENFTIFINQGKGSKDRVIPISYTLAIILKKYLEERKRLNKTCPEFFTSLNRNMGFTVDGLKHLVKNIQKAFHLKFTVHKLRHTFATLMLEGGCDIYSLSKMMGHDSIKTTTIYLAASAEHLRSQMTKHPLNNL